MSSSRQNINPPKDELAGYSAGNTHTQTPPQPPGMTHVQVPHSLAQYGPSSDKYYHPYDLNQIDNRILPVLYLPDWHAKIGQAVEPVERCKLVTGHICRVNSLGKVDLYVRSKERGRGNQKRIRGIEMNQARKLYLASYHAIDKIDKMV